MLELSSTFLIHIQKESKCFEKKQSKLFIWKKICKNMFSILFYSKSKIKEKSKSTI